MKLLGNNKLEFHSLFHITHLMHVSDTMTGKSPIYTQRYTTMLNIYF